MSRFVTKKRFFFQLWHNANLSLNEYRWMAIYKFPLCHVRLRHSAGNTPLSEGGPCIIMYESVIFEYRHFFSFGRGLSLCSRLRGTQGARPNTKAEVWALAELRGTCSGGSKFVKIDK